MTSVSSVIGLPRSTRVGVLQFSYHRFIKARHLILLVALAIFHPTIAQYDDEQMDELLQKAESEGEFDAFLEEVARDRYDHPQEALVELDRLSKSAKAKDRSDILSRIENAKGGTYLHTGEYQLALACFERSLKYSLVSKDKAGIAMAYNNLGAANSMAKSHEVALENFKKGLAIYQELGDTRGEADALHNIGTLYMRTIADEDQAKVYWEKALEAYGQIPEDEIPAEIFRSLATYHISKGNEAEASMYCERGLDLCRAQNDEFGEAVFLDIQGAILESQGHLDSAMSAFTRALVVFERTHSIENTAEVNRRIAALLRGSDRFSEAFAHDSIAFELHDELNNVRFKSISAQAMSLDLKGMGDHERALEYFVIHKDLNDSIVSNEEASVRQMLSEFEIENKEQRIKALEHEAEISRQKNQLLVLSLAFCLLLGLFFLYRTRHKKKQESEARRRREDLVVVKEQNRELELERHKNEVRSHASSIVAKDRLIQELMDRLSVQTSLADSVQDRKNTVEDLKGLRILTDSHWDDFKGMFNRAYPGLLQRLRDTYPQLTVAERRLFLLVHLGLSSNQMSGMLGISSDGVRKTRYRLRKKLNIDDDGGLEVFVKDFSDEHRRAG